MPDNHGFWCAERPKPLRFHLLLCREHKQENDKKNDPSDDTDQENLDGGGEKFGKVIGDIRIALIVICKEPCIAVFGEVCFHLFRCSVFQKQRVKNTAVVGR